MQGLDNNCHMRETESFRSIDEFAAPFLLIIYIIYCLSSQTQHSFSKDLPQIVTILLAHYFSTLDRLVSRKANFYKTKQSKQEMLESPVLWLVIADYLDVAWFWEPSNILNIQIS